MFSLILRHLISLKYLLIPTLLFFSLFFFITISKINVDRLSPLPRIPFKHLSTHKGLRNYFCFLAFKIVFLLGFILFVSEIESIQ